MQTTLTALDVTRRAVLTHSATLHAGQSRGLEQSQAKTRAKLADLQARLARGNTRRRAKLEQHLFGKRILFTNRDTWPVADVIAAYRSQSEAEFGFRPLKDPHVVSFSPMHHWTDQKSGSMCSPASSPLPWPT